MNTTFLTIVGFTIIFFATTLGSAIVFFFKGNISKKINSVLLGLSSGIMIAASIWSLLLPSIEQSETYNNFKFIPASIGFLLGGLFISYLDKIIPKINNKHSNNKTNQFSQPIKLFLAITLHNIPEGLAVGFAFGVAFLSCSVESFASALGLSVGIAIQNFPEGAAVSLPFKQVTKSRTKAFFYGMISGIIEPIAALLGFFLSSSLISLQPWFLSFSAGAMIFVVCEELIPEAKLKKNPNLSTWGFMIGFTIMMILDVMLS